MLKINFKKYKKIILIYLYKENTLKLFIYIKTDMYLSIVESGNVI